MGWDTSGQPLVSDKWLVSKGVVSKLAVGRFIGEKVDGDGWQENAVGAGEYMDGQLASASKEVDIVGAGNGYCAS